MNSSGLRRRAVLIAVAGGCVTLAGCVERGSSESLGEGTKAVRSGYGTAYGHGYGTE